MHLKKLREEMERNLKLAKTNLKKDKYLAPVALIYTDGVPKVALLRWGNDKEKEVQMLALSMLVKELHADGIITMIESWYVLRKSEDLKGKKYVPRPSLQPDRKEAIIIYGECPSGTISMSQLFHHEGKEIVFDETKDDINETINRFTFAIKQAANPMYG